jgi:uncharacterized membrane protein YeaQ/YmgE (transglycosylase-associated protein family)
MGWFSALLLGLVAGVIARMVVPGDPFKHMSGPLSWLVSIGIGLAGALLGFWFFTTVLGIGDAQKLDFGGIIGAIIGAIVVLIVLSIVMPLFNRNKASA